MFVKHPIVVYTIMNAYASTYTSVVLYAVRLTRVSSMHSKAKQKQNLYIKKNYRYFFLQIQFVNSHLNLKMFNPSSEMSMAMIMTCMCVAS